MGEVMTLEDMKAKIEARKKETREKTRGADGDGIDSNFIMECLNMNELGDGELYKKLYRDDFIFNAAMDSWMVWNGHHWEIDKLDTANASVEGAAQVYLSEVKRLGKKIVKLTAENKAGINDDEISSLQKRQASINVRISALRSTRRRVNTLTMAKKSDDPLAIDGSQLDQRPYLLACANGVVDLRTGDLKSGKQSDYLLKASPTSWPEDGINADVSEWEGVLLEIFSGKQTLVDFFRQVCGYAMLGKVTESILVVLTGRGRNGKSLIVEALGKTLGELSGAIRSEMLLDQQRVASSAGPTPDIMALRGLRMAFASETDENCRVSTSRVKWLTGNDTITGRNPHDKYEVHFKPSHTLFLLTNHLPNAPADDFAFWERVIVFPFELSFVNRKPNPEKENERKADPLLGEKLEKMQPQILAWAVRGCLEYQANGLKRPAAVIEAVGKYHDENDSLSDFIDECCVVGDGYKTRSKHLYDVFKPWWEANVSNKVPTPKRLGQLLTKRFKPKKSGVIYYLGIGIREDFKGEWTKFSGKK